MAKLALLIEVSQYQPGLTPLPAAEKDVLEMQRILQHPEIGNFSDIQILHNPDPLEMQDAIETLFSGRAKDDLLLLFFSGHGVKDDTGKLYFATRLTRKDERGALRKSTAVAASFIHDIMSNSRSKRQVVILDCCFSGAFAEGLLAKDDGAVNVKTQLGGEGRVILTSSTSTQYSFEQQGSDLSIYTRYLVEGIETGMADMDGDGVISVDELHEYAKSKVQTAVPGMKPEIYAVKEGYKIILAQAPLGDAKLRYRKEVELYASRGEISFVARQALDIVRESLRLQPEETHGIESDVLQLYRERKKKLQQYEQVLVAAMQQERTLSADTRRELKSLQQILALSDEDVAQIEIRVSTQKELAPPLADNQRVSSQSIPEPSQPQSSNTFNISGSNITNLSGSGQINYHEGGKKSGEFPDLS